MRQILSIALLIVILISIALLFEAYNQSRVIVEPKNEVVAPSGQVHYFDSESRAW